MKSILYLLIVISILTFSCQDRVPIKVDTYVGGYRIMDQIIPFPFVLNKENGVYVLYNEQGNPIDSSSKQDSIHKGDTIRFKNHSYYIFHSIDDNFIAYDLKDSILFARTSSGGLQYKNSARFFKLSQSKKADLKKTNEYLQNNIWNYDFETKIPNRYFEIKHQLQFKKNQMVHLRTYFYEGINVHHEYESKKYHLFEVNDILFMSFPNDPDDPRGLLQVILDGNNQLQLISFLDREPSYSSLLKANLNEIDFENLLSHEYELCHNAVQAPYYYGDDVTFDHGNDYLIHKIGLDAPLANKEGYITIHFNINCLDQVGNLGIEQMDRTFQPIKFNADLVHHITQQVIQLDEWPSIYSDYEFINYEDVHAFLMFKIRNGKIVDLCP